MAGPAHRNVANIRPSGGNQSSNPGAPGSPHTPTRILSSTYGSPSALRAEEDCVVLELGSRVLRVGLAGDALPKAIIRFGPEEQRRAGDHRKWHAGHHSDWRQRSLGKDWGEDQELWKLDLRSVDLGLVGDKLERAMREAFTKHLLIDSRPRRMAVALPTTLPLPLLSTVLDTLFNTFQPPTVSLMSAPMLATAAAGLRAALVVDIGWAETVVTAIFEYREVLCCRSTRACKLLGQEMQKVLIKAVEPSSLPRDEMKATTEANSNEHKTSTGIVSFEECEDVTERMAWCKPTEKFEDANATKGLASVQEEDEIEAGIEGLNISGSKSELVSIQLTSTKKPTTIQLPFSSLAEPCEVAFFGDGNEDIKWDDEELPMHQLIYRSLMKLPVDVRSICMARIIFTGGGSNIPGLKIRLLEEIHSLIRRKGWDPVEGNAVNRLLNNTKLARKRSKQASNGPIEVTYTGPPEDKVDERQNAAAFKDQESDPIEEQLRREAKRGTIPTIQGTLRAIDSMGAWSGASLLSQLKIPAVAVIEREQWLQHGISGASRPGEAIVTSTRQSMGPAGLRPGAGERSTWTLGPWA